MSETLRQKHLNIQIMTYFPCDSCRYEIFVSDDETEPFVICPVCYTRQRKPPKPKVSVQTEETPPETVPGEESDIYDLQNVNSVQIYKESIPVYCKLCRTLMYASAESIGSFLTCPDCEVKTLVVPNK